MKTQKELVEEYVRQGHTEHEFAERIKSASSKACLLCGNYPIQYVGVCMPDKELETYSLCPECTAKLMKNEKKLMRIIEKRLEQRVAKNQQDKKWDITDVS